MGAEMSSTGDLSSMYPAGIGHKIPSDPDQTTHKIWLDLLGYYLAPVKLCFVTNKKTSLLLCM